MTAGKVSFLDPEIQRCPFDAYRTIREDGPVYFDASCGSYIVTGYEEVRNAAADMATFSSLTGQLLVKAGPQQAEIDAIYAEHGFLPVNTLVVSDPPLHTFHRSLVDKVFTISRVKKMEEYIRSVISEMIAEVIAVGRMEFVAEFAMKIPTYIIADQLGVSRSDFSTFKYWSDVVISESNPLNTHEEQMRITRTICELHQYIASKAEEYRKAPAECMLSDLVHANVDGQQLSMAEIVAIVIQILVAGNDTTTSAMSSGLYRMIKAPGLEEKLRANDEAIGNFVEEVLRYDAPVQGLWRRVTKDTRVGDTNIQAGSLVILRFGAANRDPGQFGCPDDFDPDRKNARRHLTFGSGKHFCVGNQLARAELKTAFTMLLDRMRNFRLARGEDGVSFAAHVFAYGVKHLEVEFDCV